MANSEKIDTQEVLKQLRASGGMPRELMEIFSEEAEEHMRNIYDGLDRLRVDGNDAAALGDVRRSSHTLKGAAGAVGFEAVTRLSHRMEDLLDWLADHRLSPTENQLQLLLVTSDQIEDLTTTDVDFEKTAETMVAIYHDYTRQMDALRADSNGEIESEETTEQATSVDVVDDAVDEELALALASLDAADQELDSIVAEALGEELPEVRELSDEELADIRGELEKGTDIDPELAEIFNEEAQEHMLAICEGIEKLNANSEDTAAMADIRRSSHTLKGAAGAVGIMSVSRLAYRVENLLDALTENSKTPTTEQMVMLNIASERMLQLTAGEFETEEMLETLAGLYPQFECEITSLQSQQQEAPEVESMAAMAAAEVASEEEAKENKESAKARSASAAPQQYLRVPLERLDLLVSLVGEMVVNRSAFHQRLANFADRIDEMNLSLNRLRNVATEVETYYSVDALKSGPLASRKTQTARSEGGDGEELDSLEFDRYTDFHLLARSLSEATSDVAVITSEMKNLHGDFDSLLSRQQRFNRDAQSSLMHIRMVPVSNISNRLERTVRTVSSKLGKNVDLEIVGGATELDKTVLEEITDPLLHLIRNALDHGIETTEERSVVDKPQRSKLKIEALNQGTQVTIRVIDDGRGINLQKIRAKAIERGLVKEDQELTPDKIHSLIFMPGFSTADSLTDVSGRGVGMDVVREAVQRLKGTIHVGSTPGQGSVFTIHLPTSLAVSRALLVDSNGHQFALPMQAIQQIMRLDPKSVTTVGAHPMINLGDRMLLLKDLAGHLDMRTEDDKFEEAKPLLLIRTGDDEVAVTIDKINGGQDIVVKSLGDHLRFVPGYLGATVSGDGTVIPILDAADICGQKSSVSNPHFRRRSDAAKKSRNTAMVIDDSLSVRRVTTNLLRSHGWDVIDAKDGVDALEKLAASETPPNVFLCDMEMPRMDGLELVRRIRSQSEFETTPVIMVTSRAGEKHRKMGRDAGADAHVVKPFNDESLIEMIGQMVAEHGELVAV